MKRSNMLRGALSLTIFLCTVHLSNADESGTKPAKLPAQTSRYNRGDFPGRYRDEKGQIRRFALKHATSIYDGNGNKIGPVTEPLMLNVGMAKDVDVHGDGKKENCAWAWKTPAGSGWIARDVVVDAPKPDVDPTRCPKPPGESKERLTIGCAAGREKLKGLRHTDSTGTIPTSGGNMGEHYAGRNPGAKDYVYLLVACPNVMRGGVAKDSVPKGEQFIQALDEHGAPIVEVMTMYHEGDLKQPVKVTFLYGRTDKSAGWGWLARANVGEL